MLAGFREKVTALRNNGSVRNESKAEVPAIIKSSFLPIHGSCGTASSSRIPIPRSSVKISANPMRYSTRKAFLSSLQRIRDLGRTTRQRKKIPKGKIPLLKKIQLPILVIFKILLTAHKVRAAIVIFIHNFMSKLLLIWLCVFYNICTIPENSL